MAKDYYYATEIPAEYVWWGVLGKYRNRRQLIRQFFQQNCIMEYAALLWDPHLSKDAQCLKICNGWLPGPSIGCFRTTASVTKMLQELRLEE